MRPNLLSILAVGFGLMAIRSVLRGAVAGDKRRPSASAHTYVLERSQLIPAPIDEVVPFFEDPRNLADITPPGMGFEILQIDNLPMQRGTTIEYRIRPFGVPQRWSTEIAEYDPGKNFVDIQRKGPYRYWRHSHSFTDQGGRTLMHDRVEYQMPLGLLGRLAHALLVAGQLRRVFDYRTDVIVRKFGRHDAGQIQARKEGTDDG